MLSKCCSAARGIAPRWGQPLFLCQLKQAVSQRFLMNKKYVVRLSDDERRPTVSPLMMLLVCCHINSFQRAPPAWRGHSKEAKRRRPCGPRITRNCAATGSLLLPCTPTWLSLVAGWCLMAATPRGQPGMPALDAAAWARRAERAPDGGVVDVPRALSVWPRAPRINAQRGAQCAPYNTRNCLPPKKLRREIQ